MPLRDTFFSDPPFHLYRDNNQLIIMDFSKMEVQTLRSRVPRTIKGSLGAVILKTKNVSFEIEKMPSKQYRKVGDESCRELNFFPTYMFIVVGQYDNQRSISILSHIPVKAMHAEVHGTAQCSTQSSARPDIYTRRMQSSVSSNIAGDCNLYIAD